MSRRAVLAAMAMVGAMSSTAAAQSWGFGAGVEFGPGYYGPPPGYAYQDPYYYEAPPVVVVPVEPPFSRYAATPDDVFDMLEDEGYRELSPMAERGGYYKLSAVNPDGDLVALEISLRTGEIEGEFILEPARRASPPRRVVAATPPPPPPPPAAAVAPPRGDAPAPMRDRLRQAPAAPAAGDDPLVVY